MRDDEHREKLAAEANVVRMRLLRTVEALDQKRRDALDFRAQLRAHARTVAIAGAAAVVLLAGAGAVVMLRVSSAPSRLRRERWRLIGRAWRHPSHIARARPSLATELGSRLAVALLASFVLGPAGRLLGATIARAVMGERSEGVIGIGNGSGSGKGS